MSLKKALMAVVMAAAVSPIWAQSDIEETVEYSNDRYKVETNRFWSNWFVHAGAGGTVFFSDHDRQMKFGDRISPSLDIAIGKWFTPGIGVRAAYNGLSLKGLTQDPDAYSSGVKYDKLSWNGYWLYEQKIKYYNIHVDVLFNLSNLFCGYNEKRVWNISPYIGLGVIHAHNGPHKSEMSANLGLYNSFRLCKALDLTLDIRATLFEDDFDTENGHRSGEGLVQANLGLTYKIRKRDWDRAKTITRVDNGMINSLRDQLNELNAENERLQKELEEANAREVAPVKKVMASNLITFRIGKTDLSNEARANLGMMAKLIKESDPSTVYLVTGYADAGTGSKKINERLSQKRAEAVYDCLVNEFGVSEKQLKLDHKGGVDNMFYDDPRLSRAVITRAQ